MQNKLNILKLKDLYEIVFKEKQNMKDSPILMSNTSINLIFSKFHRLLN